MSAVAGTRNRMREMADGSIRVEIDISESDRRLFLELFPVIGQPVALAPLVTEQVIKSRLAANQKTEEPKAEPEKSSGSNRLAMRMHSSGWFRNPALWDVLVNQDAHKAWVMTLPCCRSESKGLIYCSGDVVAHHCNSAALPSRGGRGHESRKVPHWYTVPLCHFHHQTWAHESITRQEREALLERAVQLTSSRAKEFFKERLQISSLSEITEQQVTEFCDQFSIPKPPGE